MNGMERLAKLTSLGCHACNRVCSCVLFERRLCAVPVLCCLVEVVGSCLVLLASISICAATSCVPCNHLHKVSVV
jgi:hypothetical protein